MSSNEVTIRNYREESTLHRHAYHQIVLPQLGNLELEVVGRGGRVQSGVGAFIAAGNTHAFLAKGPNRFLVIDLPVRNDVDGRLAKSFDSKPFFPIEPPIQGLLDYATATLERMKLAAAPMGAWTQLLVESLVEVRPVYPSSEIAALSRAMAFMRGHICDTIRVKDICAVAGLSATRLYALFARHYRQSPYAALMQLRVDTARRLLAGTNLSIAEIAARTGHGDQSSLTRRLRLALGVTPAMLRRTASSEEHLHKQQ